MAVIEQLPNGFPLPILVLGLLQRSVF